MKRVLPLLFLAACATTPRFADQPIVWEVDDKRDTPVAPEGNDFYRFAYMTRVFATRQLTRVMELRTTTPAQSTNALDEVPNSTWFENRIGVREVTPEEAFIGAGRDGPPVLPLTVIAGKSGGGNPGFIAQDAADRRFLVKFDPHENPEMQTATDAIVSRLFWVMGWNTPADFVFDVARDELKIGDGATVKNTLGEKEPLTREFIDEVLETSPRQANGRYRALGSAFISGRVLGGIEPEGVRSDDPNDTIPHEHRRELRGLLAPAAWLNHTDMKEDNLLDSWVEEDGRHFVRHYLVDFGEALGAHAAEKGRREDGYEYFIDWSAVVRGMLSLGLWVRTWEAIEPSPYLAIGGFDAEPFDPDGYKEAYPFWPFFEADAADRYWGAKLVMRISRPVLESVVAAGSFSNPKAAEYLVDVLVARQRAVGESFIEAVSPLDEFVIRGGQLCGVDLGRRYELVDHGVVEVLAKDTDESVKAVTVTSDGAFCFDRIGSGYTVYRLRSRRGGEVRPTMQVHVIDDGNARIVGLVRVEPAE